MFDHKVFKTRFPLFSQPDNQSLVYLDNAATTQRPNVVIDAVADFYRHSNANTHRSSHRLARAATAMMERARDKAASFINAQSSQEVIFCRGATEALNLLANSLCAELEEGDEIVLSTAEHHANLVPWQMAAERHNLSLVFIPDNKGLPDLSRLDEVLSEKTRMVSITACSNALGFVVDIETVAKQLSGTGISLVVDAAQLAAHQAIDVQKLACDFLVCSAHKFYGPTGIGLLYGRKQELDKLPPWQGGGEMIRSVELFHSDYADAPHRFETGTSSLAAIAGLEACLDFWKPLDRPAMHIYEKALTVYLHQQLAKVETIDVLSHAENNVGIAAFVPKDNCNYSSADLAHWLDEHDIAVRVGHHCAMPLIDSLGRGATLRVSLAAYNCREDVDRLIDALHAMPVIDIGCDNRSQDRSEVEGLSLDDLKNQQQWQQRYRTLMQWANTIRYKADIRRPNCLVQGCESEAWMDCRKEDDRYYFFVDSDSRVVKGLAALLLVLLNGKTQQQIKSVDIDSVFSQLQMDKHLSPSRSNGFYALVKTALSLSER